MDVIYTKRMTTKNQEEEDGEWEKRKKKGEGEIEKDEESEEEKMRTAMVALETGATTGKANGR